MNHEYSQFSKTRPVFTNPTNPHKSSWILSTIAQNESLKIWICKSRILLQRFVKLMYNEWKNNGYETKYLLAVFGRMMFECLNIKVGVKKIRGTNREQRRKVRPPVVHFETANCFCNPFCLFLLNLFWFLTFTKQLSHFKFIPQQLFYRYFSKKDKTSNTASRDSSVLETREGGFCS